jgi:hypothetical protein
VDELRGLHAYILPKSPPTVQMGGGAAPRGNREGVPGLVRELSRALDSRPSLAFEVLLRYGPPAKSARGRRRRRPAPVESDSTATKLLATALAFRRARWYVEW